MAEDESVIVKREIVGDQLTVFIFLNGEINQN